MKPAAFEYHRPDTAEEARALLAEHGADARILAGGQSLVPLMNMRIFSPAVLVDINRCTDLSYLSDQGDMIHCGALVRQGEAERSDLLARYCPLLAEALPYVGVRANRNFGTVCGSLAHADPLAELPSVASALGARFVIAKSGGTREVGADEFYISALTNCLEPDEMLTEVRFPKAVANSQHAFLEIANRNHGFAVGGLAVSVEFDGSGCSRRVRMAAMGAGDTTVRLRETEALVEGEQLENGLIADAGARAEAEVEPADDVHASAAYRAHLIGALVRKALQEIRGRKG